MPPSDPLLQPQPQPLLLHAGEARTAPGPKGAGAGPHVRRLGLTMAGAVVIFAAGIAIWGTQKDRVSKTDRAEMASAAANAVITPVRVNLNDPKELERARASLDLPRDAADNLIAEARQAAAIPPPAVAQPIPPVAAQPMPVAASLPPRAERSPPAKPVTSAPAAQPAEAKPGTLQLAWITLYDFLDEDGDAVQVSTGGLTRTLFLRNTPTSIAVPVVPGDFLRITGVHDGNGGITVAVQAGGGDVKMVLDIGQTLTLPVR